MRSTSLFATIALASFALWPRAARATANFPNAIQDHIHSPAPDCSICHNDGDQGGKGTATEPFAINMKARGLVEFDTGTLDSALDKMAAEHVNSTGDCLDDIDELIAGHNPNVPDPPGFCTDAGLEAGAPTGGGPGGAATPPPETPTYGCIGSIAPDPSNGSPWAALVASALVFSLRRRRRP